MDLFKDISTETLKELQVNMQNNFLVIKNWGDKDRDYSSHYSLMQDLIDKICNTYYESGLNKKYEKKVDATFYDMLTEELRLELVKRDWETNNFFVKN